MPRLNLPRLLEILRKIDAELGEIWLECRNNELSERIAHQRDILSNIIEAIAVLEGN
jgi:hypothetical protein